MPKFRVPITRDCTETTIIDVDVEGHDAADALANALAIAAEVPWDYSWVPDDCSGGQSEPYFAGGDDLAAIEKE